MDRYSNEAARAAGPDIDEDSEDGLGRMCRSLAYDLYQMLREHGIPTDHPTMTRAVELLDLDPPGFDPSTEGP